MTRATETDVVVAGAGPVGLVAALALAQAGVRVCVLEKREGLNAASKASTFHPATLEVLDALGVLGEVIEQGQVVRRIQYRTPDGPFAEFVMADLAGRTRYPFRLHLEQASLTPVLLAKLEAHANAQVLFGAEFVSLAQTEDEVLATARLGDKASTLRAAFLLGTDGARSAVRDSLGVAFEGVAYPDKILRVMTTDDLDKVLPGIASITYLHNGPKSLSFLKMPDCWRIILRVPDTVDNDLALRDDWLAAQLQETLPIWTTLPTVVGRDVYGVSRRVASRYVVGRAVLAGDSAHITNTRGGMNMNCGIHDAYALAQAMIAGVRLRRKDAVEAAARERKRVADEMLIPRTDRNVNGGGAWLDKVKEIAGSRAAASAYLASAAMLDMLERPAERAA